MNGPHDEVKGPGWDTKVHCTCGEQYTSRCEWALHSARELEVERARLQFHLEEFISVTAGGVTNTSVAKNAPIWEVRQQARDALVGKSWQHDFYYETLDKAALASSLLRRVKADRPSAHSDELWIDINVFLAGDRG